MKTTAEQVLATHRISLKTIRRPNGTVDYTYSIQFSYARGKKKQLSGNTEEEVRKRVYEFYHVSTITFKELYEMWQHDPGLNESEKKKAEIAHYGFMRYVQCLGCKIAADVTPDEILEAGKKHIASGCKTCSANIQIRSIRYMYDYGIKKGIVNTNPAANVKMFRAQETAYERNYLTDRQIYEFLTECKNRKCYIFAVFLICGIDMERFVPLRWIDVDFDTHRIDINRRMGSRRGFDIVELERTQKLVIEEPEMAFDFLKLELQEQAAVLELTEEALRRSGRFIITHFRTDRNTSVHAFSLRLDDLLRRKMGAEYKMGDIFYTSAVYAFKSECDMPSVASIIGYSKTMEMFRNPEKFDLYERKKSRSVNSYFDKLYFEAKEE